MQPGYHAKIKNLIKISSVLAEAERADWLAMVDLMNDKQLVELEKILSSGLVHAAPASSPPPAPRPVVQPLRAVPAAQPPPPPPAAGRFAERVERLVQTAELKEGYPKDEPELPPPPPAPRPGAAVQPVDVATLLRRRTEAAATPPPPRPAPRPPAGGAVRSAPPPVPPPQRPLPPPPPPPPPPERPLSGALKPQAPKETPPPPGPKVELKTLEELSALGVTNWLGYPSQEFTAKLQQLMVRFGYHSVVFSLEKSPLFSSYVDTGLEILNQRANFGASEDGALSMQHLSRREFERLSDVFRQLHVG